jgi:hypothetical protein
VCCAAGKGGKALSLGGAECWDGDVLVGVTGGGGCELREVISWCVRGGVRVVLDMGRDGVRGVGGPAVRK